MICELHPSRLKRNITMSHSRSITFISSHFLRDTFGTIIPGILLYRSTLTRKNISFGGENIYSVDVLVIVKPLTRIVGTPIYVDVLQECSLPQHGTKRVVQRKGHMFCGRLDESLHGFSSVRCKTIMQTKCMVSNTVSNIQFVPNRTL